MRKDYNNSQQVKSRVGASEFTRLKALTSVSGCQRARVWVVCVNGNSTGSNLLVASTIWLTNGVLLITVEHSGLSVIIYLQAVGTEENFRVQQHPEKISDRG